jgi:hypothetical protein
MGKALNMKGRQAAWLAFSLCGIAALHLLFFFTDWYATILLLDKLMHFLGGAWLAAFGVYFLFERGCVRVTGIFYEALILVSFAALVGIGWEFHEFFADSLMTDLSRVMQTGVGDTMGDLFFDLLGATMTVIARHARFLWQNQQNHS